MSSVLGVSKIFMTKTASVKNSPKRHAWSGSSHHLVDADEQLPVLDGATFGVQKPHVTIPGAQPVETDAGPREQLIWPDPRLIFDLEPAGKS